MSGSLTPWPFAAKQNSSLVDGGDDDIAGRGGVMDQADSLTHSDIRNGVVPFLDCSVVLLDGTLPAGAQIGSGATTRLRPERLPGVRAQGLRIELMFDTMTVVPPPDQILPAQVARARISAELDLIDSAHARLRSTCTDLVGNAFRIEVAERLENQPTAISPTKTAPGDAVWCWVANAPTA